jgi:site-specific DNA recombinase
VVNAAAYMAQRFEAFLYRLKEQDELIAEFDERLWHTLVDTVTVFSEEDIRFTFQDGWEF